MKEQNPKVGPTLRYEKAAKPFELAIGDSQNIEAISKHIEQNIGPVQTVFHEMLSDKVHIDIHIVAPNEKFPFYTLVTSGMSDKKMKAPDQYPDFCHSELFLCLPSDWKMESSDWNDEAHYWPVRWLKYLARFPHEYDTWLWYGHTMPNGDPPEALTSATKLCSFILLQNFHLPDSFQTLRIDKTKVIHFFSAIPLYREELELKLGQGSEEIEARFKKNGISEVIDLNRASCLSTGGFLSRFFRKNIRR